MGSNNDILDNNDTFNLDVSKSRQDNSPSDTRKSRLLDSSVSSKIQNFGSKRKQREITA